MTAPTQDVQKNLGSFMQIVQFVWGGGGVKGPLKTGACGVNEEKVGRGAMHSA